MPHRFSIRSARSVTATMAAARQCAAGCRGATAGPRLVVRNAIAQATLQSPVEIYRFDLAAARREFEDSPQLAKQFDDFLARRMHNVVPMKVDVDRNGLATASLASGD